MRLTHRERWFVVSVAILIAAWLIFALGIRPAVERIEVLNRVIPEKQRALQELRAKSVKYLALQAGLDSLKRQANVGEEEFELLAFLESITTELRLAKKVTTMKQEVLRLNSNYSETVVEVKLESVTFKQLVEFLVRIKSSNHILRIKSLYTKKNTSSPDLLHTVIQISTLRLNETM